MVLGYNAYNSAIMADNGLILDHNCYQFQCDREPVVKPTPDQLVWGVNPTRTSSPGTVCFASVGGFGLVLGCVWGLG